ncbi:MAG TPA: hypothetical protein GXX14_09555 [Clostridiaceae bacterium]|nr:hypothetical protein [Clostridiaceae bacterium]
MYTPKQRMLNAYRGIFSDRYPVAPEFWYYYPAKVLGVTMIEFERELPFWKSLQTVFKKYGTEGWGAVFPKVENEDIEKSVKLEKISPGSYRETVKINYSGKQFISTKIYDENEPSWVEKYPVEDVSRLYDYIDMLLSEKNIFDFSDMDDAYNKVGEDYLLEVWMGTPFFDFIAEIMGFEKTVFYFMSEDEDRLASLRERYIEYQKRFIRKVCENTCYESFVIGCSYSCNSLIGPAMWRKWDKPYIKAMADELHALGKLLHVHFHGKCIETVSDFAQIGIDCVCPFERGPGGDVNGLQGLLEVRRLLNGKVTMNGNVHTVETLIRGGEQDVRREVQEIKEAFKGSARLIIGTGDQVGRETPEENILAMIDEARR